jgi:hypothetical protein
MVCIPFVEIFHGRLSGWHQHEKIIRETGFQCLIRLLLHSGQKGLMVNLEPV